LNRFILTFKSKLSNKRKIDWTLAFCRLSLPIEDVEE
jgi:hypothetical protein